MTDQRRIVDDVAELLTIEARMEGLGRRGAALRQNLEAKAREIKSEQGVASTWRAPGLGTASFSDPQPRVLVKDPAALASWVAQRFPSEVTATIAIPAAAPELLERALAALAENDIPIGTVAAEVRPSWLKEFIDGCAAVDDPPCDEVFAPETGDRVDGLHLAPAAPGRLSVRLDSEAKARAVAELADPEVAAGMIGRPLGAPVSTARAAQIRDGLVEDPEAADGEPDYDVAGDEGPTESVERTTDSVASPAPLSSEAEAFDLPAGTALEDLKVPELQALCRDRTLSHSGRKADLVARLRNSAAVPA